MNYPHQLPRFLHKAGNQLYVSTVDACVVALQDGWLIDPNDQNAQTPASQTSEPIEPVIKRHYTKKGKHTR